MIQEASRKYISIAKSSCRVLEQQVVSAQRSWEEDVIMVNL